MQTVSHLYADLGCFRYICWCLSKIDGMAYPHPWHYYPASRSCTANPCFFLSAWFPNIIFCRLGRTNFKRSAIFNINEVRKNKTNVATMLHGHFCKTIHHKSSVSSVCVYLNYSITHHRIFVCESISQSHAKGRHMPISNFPANHPSDIKAGVPHLSVRRDPHGKWTSGNPEEFEDEKIGKKHPMCQYNTCVHTHINRTHEYDMERYMSFYFWNYVLGPRIS